MVQDKYGQKGSLCPIGFKVTQNYMLSDLTNLFLYSCHIGNE